MEWGRGVNCAWGTVPECGAIFMSNKETGKECFRRRLFGLPSSLHSFVAQVKTGMILFLFEYESRQLYGVFQACSDGAMNIVPHAFSASGKQFPAQVKLKPLWHCAPLSENAFRDIIKENYFTAKKFNFGLSEEQVHGLVSLFARKILKENVPRKQILEFRADDEFERTSLQYQQVNGFETDTNQVEFVGHYRKSNDIESFTELDHQESEPPLGGKISSYNLDCYLQGIVNNIRSTREDTEDSRAMNVVNAEASVIHTEKCSSSSVSERYLPEHDEASASVRLGRDCYAAEWSGLGISEASYLRENYDSSVREESCRNCVSCNPSIFKVTSGVLPYSSGLDYSDHPVKKPCLETKLPSFEIREAYCPSCSSNIRGNSSASCFDDRLTNTCLQEFESSIKWSSDTLPSWKSQWNIPYSTKYSPMGSSFCAHCIYNETFHGGNNKQFNPQMSNVNVHCSPGCPGFAHCVPQKRKRNSVFSRLSSPIGEDVEMIDKSDHRDSPNMTPMLHHQRRCFATESANDISIGMTYRSEWATVQPNIGGGSIVSASASFDISHASDGKYDSENVVDPTPLHNFRRRSLIRKNQDNSVLKSSENPPSSIGPLVGPSGRRKLIRPDFSKKEALVQKSIADDLSGSCPAVSFDTGSAIKDVNDDSIVLKGSEDVKNLSMAAPPQVFSQIVIADKESGTNKSVRGKVNDQDTFDFLVSEERKPNQVLTILGQENGARIGFQKKLSEIQETPNSENAGVIESCEHNGFLLEQSTSTIDLTANNSNLELPVVELVACGGHDTLVSESATDIAVPASIDGPCPIASSEEPVGIITDDGKRNEVLLDGTGCKLYLQVDQETVNHEFPVLPETEYGKNKALEVLPGGGAVGADVGVGINGTISTATTTTSSNNQLMARALGSSVEVPMKNQVNAVLKSSENPPSSIGTLVGPSGRRKLIRPDFSKKEAPVQKSIADDLSRSCPAVSFDAGSAIKDVNDDSIVLKGSEDVKNLSMAAPPQVFSQIVIADKESGTNESVGGKINDQDTFDFHGSGEWKPNQVLPILGHENGACIGFQKKSSEIQETSNSENAGVIEFCEHDGFLLEHHVLQKTFIVDADVGVGINETISPATTAPSSNNQMMARALGSSVEVPRDAGSVASWSENHDSCGMEEDRARNIQ